MTSIVPIPMPRLSLLIKANGDFKHSGKYYLLAGRWHKLNADKPAPKGAPVSQAPNAAGMHMPVTLFSDQIEKLKYPADKAATNKEMAAHNDVHLPKLLEHAANGDATAIVGQSYGVNSHGKKKALAANLLLAMMGSTHQVAPGQKAGEHHAVSQPVTAEHHEQVNQEAQKASDAAVVAEAAPKIGPIGQALKEAIAAPASNVTGLDLPAFVEGKTTSGVVEYYAKVANTILDMAAAKDVDGLAKLKHYGSKPNGKGKISNTWAGKTANSKLLIALHAEAIGAAGGNKPAAEPEPAPEPIAVAVEPVPAPEPVVAPAVDPQPAINSVAQIPWESQKLPDSNSNAKSHNGKVDQIQAMAAAGDVAGLEAFKAGKNTYGKKQMQLAALAIAALKTEPPVTAPVAEPVAVEPVAAAEPLPEPVPLPEPPSLAQIIGEAGSPNKAIGAAVAHIQAGESSRESYVEAISALKLHGYDGAASALKMALNETHPKEGDTKEGEDGTLVLKDGHWVKVEEPGPVALLSIPAFSSASPANQATLTKMAEYLQGAVAHNGLAGIKGVIVKNPKSITIKIDGKKVKVANPPQAPWAKELVGYIDDLKAVAAKMPKVKAAPAPAPSPIADYQPANESMDGWEQTGPQAGSNPGGKYKDADGVEWYCKFPGSDDVAKSEVLAAKLYAAAGVAGQDAKLITKGGKLGIASKWQSVSKLSPAALAKADGVASGFAVDAWLGNWDVVGMEYDNLQVGPDGKAMRVDAGGSLEYRAQGGKKAFGEKVVELDSLRDAKINTQSAAVFGHMSKADLTASVSKVLSVSDAKIHALVYAYGPGDDAAKLKMINTLIARKADLAEKFPKAKKEKKTKPFKPESISAPPSFINWGGSGKSGPSSKDFLNVANENAVQAIYAAAQTGSLDAIHALSASIYNKESGDVTGSAPVLEHPSQHVKGYAQQTINEINYQLNPPKRFRFEGGHPLHSLNSAYPSHKGAVHGAVSKVAKFILLGEPGTVSLQSLALPKHTYQSGAITTGTFSPAAKKSIAAMPETQKQAVKAYTGSGYGAMNQSLWSGNPTGAAKSAGEALHALGHEITPGTVLSRKISVQGSGLDQILKSAGKILQEPAIMSTSIRPSSWSGNVQLKMHVGPGVKGLWVGKGSVGSNGALSNHSGEDELILPPNTRLLILSVKTSGGQDADGFGGSGISHVIEAVILPTQASA